MVGAPIGSSLAEGNGGTRDHAIVDGLDLECS
jgi:hypothetical protein